MVGGAERKFEITAILIKYKNTLNNLIDSKDTESADYLDSLNWPELIDKRSHNMLKSRDSSPTFLKKDYLDKNISIMLLESAPKI